MKNKTYIAKWTGYFALAITAKNKEEAEKKWQRGKFNEKDVKEISEFPPEVEIEEE